MVTALHDHLLPWVREHGQPEAAMVTAVEPFGDDWAGDTEAGFHSNFRVTIKGARADGSPFWLDVEGEEMESLWKWTVQAGDAESARSLPGEGSERAEEGEPR